MVSSSRLRAHGSHSAISATLLSTSLKALTWSSVRSSIRITGTSFRPSCFAASSLVCPAMIVPEASISIGLRKPNSWIERATGSIASSFLLGLFS